ncbi:MAG TPA: hypothetical protein VIC26_09110 [Marinagarivorans sp.]
MKNILYAPLVLTLSTLLGCGTVATVPSNSTGNLTATTECGWLRSKSTKSQAERIALMNYLDEHVARNMRSSYRTFNAERQSINQEIEKYFFNYFVEEKREGDKCTYYARGEINTPRLELALMGGTDHLATHDPAAIAAIFVAREQTGVIKQNYEDTSSIKEQQRSINRVQGDSSNSMTKGQRQTVGRAGTQVVTYDQAIWRVSSSGDIEAALSRVFNDALYSLINVDTLESESGYAINVQAIKDEYGVQNEISADLKGSLVRGLEAMGRDVDFLAIGRLDIAEQGISKTTGNPYVVVSVTATVLGVDSRATVASIGPISSVGEGLTVSVARSNALSLAAESAARAIVAQLNTRSIR